MLSSGARRSRSGRPAAGGSTRPIPPASCPAPGHQPTPNNRAASGPGGHVLGGAELRGGKAASKTNLPTTPQARSGLPLCAPQALARRRSRRMIHAAASHCGAARGTFHLGVLPCSFRGHPPAPGSPSSKFSRPNKFTQRNVAAKPRPLCGSVRIGYQGCGQSLSAPAGAALRCTASIERGAGQ